MLVFWVVSLKKIRVMQLPSKIILYSYETMITRNTKANHNVKTQWHYCEFYFQAWSLHRQSLKRKVAILDTR